MDWYLGNIRENNIDPHRAIQWLDVNTRTNYITGDDTEPCIESKLLKYLIGEGFSEWWDNKQ